jgi:Na+-translocating ferredoxin:NAD+ oxidoreductase RnfA subunit
MVFFVSGFDRRDFDGILVVTVVVVFVSSILLEGFPTLARNLKILCPFRTKNI